MSLTAPVTRASGDLITAAIWNNEHVNDLGYLVTAGANLASADTITPTNEFHIVTGATTIGNLTPSTPVAGQQVRLLFQSALTVKNNESGTGNIRTASGSDLNVAANQVVTFVYDGTVWREQRGPVGGGAAICNQTNLSGNATSSAAAGVMAGMGSSATIVPSGTRVLVICAGNVLTSGTVQNLGVAYGTGTAPSSGAAHTGTNIANGAGSQTNTVNVGFSAIGIVTGLTAGTTYWLDMFLSNTSNVSIRVSQVSIVAFDLL